MRCFPAWRRISRRLYPVVLALMIGPLPAGPLKADDAILVRGGSISGLYYRLAGEICAVWNDAASTASCTARPGLGSVFNINAIGRGLQMFAFAQSDRSWQAWYGEDEWRNLGPVGNLRSLFGAHDETVLLVVRKDAGIRQPSDLVGKRVNIGNPASGQRGNAELVLSTFGIDADTDIMAEALQQSAAAKALIAGDIDALFYTVGNPSEAISAPADSADIDILDLDSDAIRAMVDTHPYLSLQSVPAGTYHGVDHKVTTFGLKAMMLTSTEVPDDLAYRMVKTVFDNLDRVKAAHPAFRTLNAPDMVRDLTPPLHEGAKRYYRERGWIGAE
ncbi:TAXI family TRAP transporter solute-binding subunit [Breoghania sp. L-A4]|uniref:TAXI family TRAP transporter solute-binding subunit n=1 Tax=Breoghania sp. L-A4 TaxID=2304600 RepID=UPI0013C2B890|nr:TAXI family TRAP transporter solute-binding subunit [Breoghania sp. L-A4]